LRVTWYGHSCFLYEIGEKKILIDPFLKDNPASPIKPEDVKEADLVLVTHDHFDHLGDAVSIMKRTKAASAAVFELANWFEEQGVPGVVGANVGGTVRFGPIGVSLVPANHSCSRGVPVGYVLTGGGDCIYHAGDTCYIAEMEYIGRRWRPTLACLPIGGHFTMDVEEAIEAALVIKPRCLIPMHYNTWSPIRVDEQAIVKLVASLQEICQVKVMRPGETLQL